MGFIRQLPLSFVNVDVLQYAVHFFATGFDDSHATGRALVAVGSGLGFDACAKRNLRGMHFQGAACGARVTDDSHVLSATFSLNDKEQFRPLR